jgi:hypothetical protein
MDRGTGLAVTTVRPLASRRRDPPCPHDAEEENEQAWREQLS